MPTLEAFLNDYLHVGPLLALSVAILLANLIAVLTGRGGIPLIGALVGIFACLSHPTLRPYAWMPLVFDLATLKLIYELPAAVRREKRLSTRQSVARFVVDEALRRVAVDLFDDASCRLRVEVRRDNAPIGEPTELEGTWRVGGPKRNRRLALDFSGAESGRYEFSVAGDQDKVVCERENHPLARRQALTGLTLELVAGTLPKSTPATR